MHCLFTLLSAYLSCMFFFLFPIESSVGSLRYVEQIIIIITIYYVTIQWHVMEGGGVSFNASFGICDAWINWDKQRAQQHKSFHFSVA